MLPIMSCQNPSSNSSYIKISHEKRRFIAKIVKMRKKNLQIALKELLIDQFPIFFRQSGSKFYVDTDFHGRW